MLFAVHLCVLSPVLAQSADSLAGQHSPKPVTTSSDWAWRPVTTADSLQIDYIFYADKGSVDNAVVMRLVNHSTKALSWRFVLIVKGTESVFEQEVRGEIAPESLLTGDAEGLYWVPFADEEPIAELGLRGLTVEWLIPGR
ncbi:MAG: hypothetical protein O2797_05860 [Bacteroidetes bacterium]|nr:hypothetical protein [Bacteroidota bacterium]